MLVNTYRLIQKKKRYNRVPRLSDTRYLASTSTIRYPLFS